jgi:hypothetical protein
MPDIHGIFLLMAPALEYYPTILEDCVLSNCRQIVTGTYPRVLQELGVKVVASLEGLDKEDGVMNAIVEWGAQPQDLRRMGLLVGPLPEDFKKHNWVQSWDMSEAWVHVHIKYI